jgi:murein L,D-transpeptidase YcbB/YkuD
VQLDSGVPIYLLYLTARPDGETVAFAPDVYGLDTSAPVKTTSVADRAAAH